MEGEEVDTTTCKPCRGSGSEWNKGVNICPVCEGYGRVPIQPGRIMACVRCSAKGLLGAMTICDVCDGYGWVAPLRERPAEPTGSEFWFVKAGKPFSERLRLASVLETLRGDVCVCDPYYGAGLLSALRDLEACDSVRCLTREFERGSGRKGAEHEIGEFKTEYSNTEFRRSTSGDLHDRYVVGDTRLLILGQGIKDFGKDDSFVIALDAELAADTIKSVKDTFEAHWADAEPLG